MASTNLAPECPVVSVIIPTFGRSEFLAEAVASVRAQTWPHIELIIVDDHSPDPVGEIEGAVVVRHARNLGPGAARNTGLAHATGEYILFLDDDDWLARDRVRWAVEEIGDHRIHACRQARVVDGRHTIDDTRRFEGDLRRTFLEHPPPHISQVVCRREDVVQMDPTLRSAQDVEWWARMVHAADFAWSDETGHFFRTHDGDRHGRPPPLDARRVIVLRQWPTATRRARARMAGRLAYAYRNAGKPRLELWWHLRAFATAPSVRRARQVLGVLKERILVDDHGPHTVR